MTSCTSGPVPSSITFEAGYLPELEGSTEAVLSFPPILYAGSRQVIAFTGLAAATSGNANYFALVCAAGACCAGSCTLTCCNAVNQISLTTVRTIGLPTNVERGVIYRTAGLTEGFYRACLLANAPAPFAGTFSTFAAAVQVYSSNQPPPLPPPVPPVGPYPSLPPPSPFSPSPPSPPPMPPPVESVWMYPGPRPFSDGLGSCLDFGGGASSASGTATSSATPPKPPMSPLPAPPMAPPPCTLNYIQSCTPPSPPASVVECLTIGTLVGIGIGGSVHPASQCFKGGLYLKGAGIVVSTPKQHMFQKMGKAGPARRIVPSAHLEVDRYISAVQMRQRNRYHPQAVCQGCTEWLLHADTSASLICLHRTR